VNAGLRDFYGSLLRLVTRQTLLEGEWQLCECQGWADNQSHLNLLAWCWTNGDRRHVIVINYSDFPGQGHTTKAAGTPEAFVAMSEMAIVQHLSLNCRVCYSLAYWLMDRGGPESRANRMP